MEALTEDFSRPEEMTVLAPEDFSEQNIDTSDEVENLRKSLCEAVHDENIQPKMQCLMMDSSFSMVTMQEEDSGIEWETTPSRCTTPWASEAGNPSVDTLATMGPALPGSHPAGKIIIVMDEELITKQKKTKERGRGSKGKGELQQEVFLGSSDNISGRPELVGFSLPNVKPDEEELEEELTDPSADKEQKLFRLVSEGSEILNIIVPPKLATVDEEESKEMVDNLFYLEASPVVKVNEEIHEQMFELQREGHPTLAPTQLATAAVPLPGVHSMDPPGAPVPRPLVRQVPGNGDYFEAFALIDAQAPGSPAVAGHGQDKAEEAVKTLEPEKPGQTTVTSTTTTLCVDDKNADNISLAEMTSELLDEVFYCNTDNYIKTTDRADVAQTMPSRLSLKPTGSTLFGSQEDILTPIYLPEGPRKIIDPILLEEPQAMAFLYTDLYEEAIGSWKKEEDTESMTSEKSFHSRHSDREARGYLEKYMLIDETPVLEVQPSEKVPSSEERPRVMSQKLYDHGDLASKPEKIQILASEEEVTDFFRSSANSSPCLLEPFPQATEEDEDQTATKTKAKTNKNVVIVTEKIPESTVDSFSEFPIDEPDVCTFNDPIYVDEKDEIVHTHQQPLQQHVEIQLPVAPPRKKASSSLKACLDLAPLTPVELQEEQEAGGKEQQEEEKETASPVETADEGDGEETMKTFSEDPIPTDTLAAEEAGSPPVDGVAESENETTVSVSCLDEEKLRDIATRGEKTETTKQNVLEEVDTGSTKIEPKAESSTVTPSEPAKDKGQCIIL